MQTALKALQLKARHQVYTLLSGQHLSRLYGEGYDFAELREYQMGDDVRKINWTITAKLGRPYLKELHANRELSVALACLMDAGLYMGPTHSPHVNAKQLKMTEVATLLGYAAHQSGDLLSAYAFTPHHTHITPPTKQLHAINSLSEYLYTQELLGSRLERQQALERLFRQIDKPSLLFLIDDFLHELDLSLLAQKHELIAIIIRAREEESPKNLGEVILQNPATGATQQSYLGYRGNRGYTAAFEKHEKARKAHFHAHNIRSVTIYTDEDALGKLLTLFA